MNDGMTTVDTGYGELYRVFFVNVFRQPLVPQQEPMRYRHRSIAELEAHYARLQGNKSLMCRVRCKLK